MRSQQTHGYEPLAAISPDEPTPESLERVHDLRPLVGDRRRPEPRSRTSAEQIDSAAQSAQSTALIDRMANPFG